MSKQNLTVVTRTQGNNSALKSGKVKADGFALDFKEVPVLPQAFRRMVRQLEFDVCEMALTTYLCAREHGVRFTALPIFLVRAFHHGAIVRRRDSDVTCPADLDGKRVGVHRGYTVTTGVWARAVLQDEYGLDLSNITWVLSGDEHVEAYQPPDNVERIAAGSTIEELLEASKLAAAIGLGEGDENLVPLIPDPLEAGLAAFRDRGHYPINHLIVVRDDVLDRHPDVAVALFDAFVRSRDLYLSELRRGEVHKPGPLDKLYARILDMGRDPLPYGIEPNRTTLNELVTHAQTQKILRKAVDLDTVFAPATRNLSA